MAMTAPKWFPFLTTQANGGRKRRQEMASGLETELKMQNRGKWLCRAGWGLFGASLLLPAVFVRIMGDGEWWSGWKCAWLTANMAWSILTQQEGFRDGWTFYYAGFAVSNAAMLLSPLIHRWLRGDRRRMRRWTAALAGATLYTLSYPGLGLTDPSGFHMGYYAWLLSFPLLTLGALHLAVKRKEAHPSQLTKNSSMTEEELAALRELEEYLGAAARPPVPPVYGDEEVQAVRPQENLQTKLGRPVTVFRGQTG
jgi:hypothetical protein